MRVYATTRKLKADQHNKVDDEATILLDYPDATAVIEPSWDWSYSMDRTYVFGSKGSLLSTRSDLFERVASDQGTPATPDGARLVLGPVPHEMSNPIAYMIDCIRNNKPVEDPLSGKLNVQVMEILDAARESVRTGKAVDLR
jgi:predicted dehydrogenase